MKGDDVLAAKYALKKAGYGKGIVMTRRFGSAMWWQVGRFQKKNGLPVDHKVGSHTYDALRRHMPPYACWLLEHAHVEDKSVAQKVVAEALFLAQRASSIHYTQGPLRWQGIDRQIKPPSFPRYADCSSFATYCYWVAGGEDPNGLDFKAGYTGTLATHGRKVVGPQPGDLVLYGSRWPYEHVAVYIGNGRVISHGSEAGPLNLPVHYRRDYAMYRRYT